MNVGFIGFGNMAQAIAKGLLEKNIVDSSNLLFSNKTLDKRKKLETTFNIKGTGSNQEVWDTADVIILAVKPYQVEAVLQNIQKDKQPFVLSVVAGVTSKQLQQYLPTDSFMRTMPNLNAQVGESITALIENPELSEEDLQTAHSIFQAVGETVTIPEAELGAFIAIAGSSPALVFFFIDLLARSAVKYGIPKEKATKIAAQAVLGSGKTILDSEESPWNLIDQVSSPGGITVEGITSLLEDEFSGSVLRSVDKMIEKNDDLSKN